MKLNNKGISLIEVLVATIVISYAILFISNNLNNAVRLNEATADRVEAFNNAELLSNHLVVIESGLIADNLNPTGTEVSKYTYDDCSNSSSPIRTVLNTVDNNADYCQSIFAPSYNQQYNSGMIELYIFESLQSNFDYITNPSNGFSQDMINYVNSYDGDYYSEGLLDYRVDNIVILVYFFEDIPLVYSDVIVYEIP